MMIQKFSLKASKDFLLVVYHEAMTLLILTKLRSVRGHGATDERVRPSKKQESVSASISAFAETFKTASKQLYSTSYLRFAKDWKEWLHSLVKFAFLEENRL